MSRGRQCSHCGASILPTTYLRTGTLCMPCFKKENRGRTPAQLTSLRARNLLTIDESWHQLSTKIGADGGDLDVTETAGHLETLLSNLDGDVDGAVAGLRQSLLRLEQALPYASGPRAEALGRLAELVRRTLGRVGGGW